MKLTYERVKSSQMPKNVTAL